MKHLRLLILFSVAILAIGITTYLALAREVHPGHASGNTALDGPLSNATVSFGGGKFLFRSRGDGQAQIWTMNADGSDKRQITCNNDGNVQDAIWSPDGQLIIFTRAFPNNIQQLFLIGANEESCGPGMLLTAGRFPDWSPVGQKIAFDRGSLGVRDIYVMYRDGTVGNVTNDPGGRNIRPSWAPDGQKIAFAHGP